MKLSKKSKYNLSDGEEDELEIQGGLFPEKDDFDDEILFDDDEDDSRSATGSKYIILSSLQMRALYRCVDVHGYEIKVLVYIIRYGMLVV